MRLAIMTALMLTLLSAEPREALLIGNHTYTHISNLDDPSYNLGRLKKSLKSLNFNVEVEKNLNSENLENAIEQFKNRLARNANTIGFLYYTGHGCQVDYQGYLVPTNVDTQKKLKIKYNALNINQMLENLKGAGNKVNLLFLDACRDVPTGTKGGTKGLGQPLEKPIGTLLVYATEAGKVTNDNAKFINALIDNISKPNQYIKDIGDNISRVVAVQSSYKQIPEVFSKLLPERMVLKGGYVAPPKPIVVPVQPVYVPKPVPVVVKPKPISTSKWIPPTKKEVTWKKAKELCSANGGRLPTIEELKKVVTDCGGEMKDYNLAEWERNEKNTYYQNCYKKRGFNSNGYWSSTSLSYNNDTAWFVHFNVGFQNYNGKDNNYYVRCVRAGQ
jgi:hypothetical protein